MENTDALLDRVQTTIESYSFAMGQFGWDRAKEMVEKERDSLANKNRCQISHLVSSMLTALAQLALAEKNYMSLNFLAPKGFLRKDVLKGMYEALRNEFERLEERGSESQSGQSLATSVTSAASAIVTKFRSGSPSTSSSNSSSPAKTSQTVMDKFASHVCGQLLLYVKARLDLIAVYERIVLIASLKFCVFDDLVAGLTEIVKSNQNKFHHPLLSSIKAGFTFESEVLLTLVQAYIDIQHYRFLTSLFYLQEAQVKLTSWANATVNRDSPKRSGLIRTSSLPPLYQWMCKLKSSLVSKYSLYFYSILSKQAPAPDFRSACAKQSNDYIQKVMTFHKKSNAFCTCILFDTHGEDYRGPGYRSPHVPLEPFSGIESFPAIFSYPIERPLSFLPALIMIMNSKAKDLNTSDTVVYFYDNQTQATFFLARQDPKMTLIVIFESRKSEKDSQILTFIQDLVSSLKCNKLFVSLKQGSK